MVENQLPRFPKKRPIIRRGQPPGLFYGLLRHYYNDIVLIEQTAEISARQAADQLGMNRSIYLRIRDFINEHEAEVANAEQTGDWTQIEIRLFKRFPNYTRFPFYKEALRIAESGMKPRIPLADETPKKKRGRPPGTKNKPKDLGSTPTEPKVAPTAPAVTPIEPPLPEGFVPLPKPPAVPEPKLRVPEKTTHQKTEVLQ